MKNLIAMLMALAMVAVLGGEQAAAQGSHGSMSYGARVGVVGRVHTRRDARQNRRANRLHRRISARHQAGSHGGTAHATMHTEVSSGWQLVESAPVVVSGGSAGSTSYQTVPPAKNSSCPNCVGNY